ncbi:MAG TPA: hypothetical protein VIX11_12630 [Candidatus Acidoferrum sp.]
MAVDMHKLNVFVAQLLEDLGAAAHSGTVVIGEKLGLYKAAAESPPALRRVGTTCRRKRHRRTWLRQLVIAAAVLACALLTSSPSYSESASNNDERVLLELSALGKRGDTIARAREQVLDILQNGNSCSAWFQEADPDAADVFRSLHFELEMEGPSYVYSKRDGQGGELLKHPWAARSIEYGGRNSTILLNANGPFFNRNSVIMELDPKGMLARPGGIRTLTTSSFEGNTPGARITILLHELGHIIGRLPEDDDSWDGRSSRNTSEMLRHCKDETRAAAHNSSRGSI